MDAPDRPDVFLFSSPRTMSNLLVKLVSDQPRWKYSVYHFHEAFRYLKFTLGEVPLDKASPEQQKEYTSLLQQGFAKLQADRENAKEKGEPIFIKNHAFQLTWPTRLWSGAVNDEVDSFCIMAGITTKTNPTFLPDYILTSVIPIFTIRHPALVVESWYRTESRALEPHTSAKIWRFLPSYDFLREVYDWFLQRCPEQMQGNRGQGPFHPIIIEADDILEENQTIEKLCKLINMESALVPSEWDVQELPTDAYIRSYVQGLFTSTSIDKSKSGKGLDLQHKYQDWRDEFGTETADYLITLTERDLANYFYLREKRL